MAESLSERLIARSAFAEHPELVVSGPDLFAMDRDGLGLATVIARKNATAALAARVRALMTLDLPLGPRRVATGDFAFIGVGPDTWLVTSEGGGNAAATWLAKSLGELASVSDQADGQAVLRLGGRKVREVLSHLLPLDVHPRAFKIGDAASSVASHVGVTLWRLEDRCDQSPVFELAVPRSMATSLRCAVLASASMHV